jgi:hypothetical protein
MSRALYNIWLKSSTIWKSAEPKHILNTQLQRVISETKRRITPHSAGAFAAQRKNLLHEKALPATMTKPQPQPNMSRPHQLQQKSKSWRKTVFSKHPLRISSHR